MPVELRTYKKRFRPLQLNQGNCVVFATQTRWCSNANLPNAFGSFVIPDALKNVSVKVCIPAQTPADSPYRSTVFDGGAGRYIHRLWVWRGVFGWSSRGCLPGPLRINVLA